MNFILRFILWLCDRPEYGNIGHRLDLYRRHRRTGRVQVKLISPEDGQWWIDIRESQWYLFQVDDRNIKVSLPDRTAIYYFNHWRDKTGEQAFNRWLENHRREALENLIKQNNLKHK